MGLAVQAYALRANLYARGIAFVLANARDEQSNKTGSSLFISPKFHQREFSGSVVGFLSVLCGEQAFAGADRLAVACPALSGVEWVACLP